MINIDCDFGEEYPFLKVYEPEGREDYEVTKEAMNFVHNYYNYYKQNYKEPERRYDSQREKNQSSAKGWSISRKEPYEDKEKPCINVVADVFTTPKAFPEDLKDATGMKLLEKIYHTVGNFIPIPEAANFKPGQQGKVGNSDHFEFKLNTIKEFFDEESKKSKKITKKAIYQVSERIKDGYSLSSNAWHSSIKKWNKERKEREKNEGRQKNPPLKSLKDFSQLRYWIQLEWKDQNKTWKDFVEENYLQDFVDSYWKPVKFDREDPLGLCERIIRRGYRISHKGELDKAEINKMFNDLGIPNISSS